MTDGLVHCVEKGGLYPTKSFVSLFFSIFMQALQIVLNDVHDLPGFFDDVLMPEFW